MGRVKVSGYGEGWGERVRVGGYGVRVDGCEVRVDGCGEG